MAQKPRPPDPFPLSPEQIQRLRLLPRHEQATLLISGRPLPGGLPGPLDASSAFSDEVARLAYFVHLAWMHGRMYGVLSGKPSYEAREMLASRLRGSVARAGDLASWGVELFGRRGLGAKLEKLGTEDAMWWRRVCADASACWRLLHRPVAIAEILTSASLLGSWLYTIEAPTPDADLSDIPDHLHTEI